MIINNSNISMNASSSIRQVYAQEIKTTNLSNPSVFSLSTTEMVSLQLQNSSFAMSNQNAASANNHVYKNPNYKNDKREAIHDGRANGHEKGGVISRISDDARKLANAHHIHNAPTHGVKMHESRFDNVFSDFRYSLLDSIVRLLTGGKSDLLSLNPHLDSGNGKLSQMKKELEGERNSSQPASDQKLKQPVLLNAQPIELTIRPVGFQQLDITTSFYEQQKMDFQAVGSVTTADGRQINLEVNMSMSSEFYSSNQTTLTQVLKDPLVMNLGPGPVELTQTKFDFDIDCDGKADQISFTAGNSGFLVLDKNNDGKINDGNELFGAVTGDGFKELAEYDQDGNGWIDEADEIFNSLRIWMKDEDGNDQLLALGESGIGALYLGNVNSDYNIRGDDGNINAQIRKTGIYLNENGTAGTMHHVDIAI